MGIEKMHPPKYWRDRAEEFRAKADNCEHKRVKEPLRKIAKTYDDIARRSELIRTVQDAAE
ncbi:hypothetical protein ACVIW2_004930 [Bradyrhizobium huanghuaihaiense]|uniref:Uncharacterized protein n=1 Tax=Bradyrhizobium huanghuaihaiense TaxID=990078 RepID=A0A562R5N5_9BRAD|nr:hypothetical protein [Bradyrhizobium huanghuaihaiense]TWI64163.1 hypothetical protein IQ16_06038 [Bradyrhizobium huanghuaihaiense]